MCREYILSMTPALPLLLIALGVLVAFLFNAVLGIALVLAGVVWLVWPQISGMLSHTGSNRPAI